VIFRQPVSSAAGWQRTLTTGIDESLEIPRSYTGLTSVVPHDIEFKADLMAKVGSLRRTREAGLNGARDCELAHLNSPLSDTPDSMQTSNDLIPRP
jgi:hypothetical protein